jgi:choline dehydrogenase-like flavoprotein
MSGPGDGVDRTPSERVDVCVIGGGVAGALVADQLSSDGYETVILEAGKRFPPPGQRSEQLEVGLRPSHADMEVWNVGGKRDAFTSSGERFYPLNDKRVKGVGGSTLHWGGYTPRLHEKDFRMQSRYDLAADWPLSYRDLQPYYRRAERELGVAGDDNPFVPREEPLPLPGLPPSDTDAQFAEACAELGITTHSLPQARNSEVYDGRPRCEGYATCEPVCPIGAKYSGDVHIRKAEESGTRVIDRAPVQYLDHGRNPSTVEAAVYATPDGRTHRQEARQFVVACGGVETPRLLLLSRSEDHPEGLANSSGLLGRYFFDHPYVNVTARVDVPGNPNPAGFPTTISQEFYEHEEPSPGSFMLQFQNNDPIDIVGTALRGGPETVRDQLLDPVLGDPWGDTLLESIREAKLSGHARVTITAAIEDLPRKTNAVGLDPSTTDDHGNPVPDVSWSVGPHAERTIRRAETTMRRIVEELDGDVVVTTLDTPSPGGHHMGTTRMGTDPDESVVDPRLRTHDVENLTVASSSVFVTGGAANPTLTIAALALKAVDHLRSDL